MITEWKSHTKPLNETLVEVELDGEIIRVEAVFGRDGMRPHWRTEDGTTLYHPSRFTKWREIEKVEQ